MSALTRNLQSILLERTKWVMMSLNLMYARYEFFKNEQNKVMNKDNCSVMFQSNKSFEKRYGLSKKKLLEKYSYTK